VTTVAEIADDLGQLAPISLAEDWDNVGLLVGNRAADVSSVMTCLTLTANVADEAIARNAQLIISHHPVLFRAVQRLTAETVEGRMLLNLIAAGVSVYSPHTGFDSASDGINQQLADLLELSNIGVLRPIENNADGLVNDEHPIGAGRFGDLAAPTTLAEFIDRVKACLDISDLQFIGDKSDSIERVGIACGAAAEFLRDAADHGCQVLLTGEARFHACLEAQARGIALVLPGHYATERPAIEQLAKHLGLQFPELTVWASESESDPVQWS